MASGKFSGTINRIYYACFYIVSALLLKYKLVSKTHTGTKILFQKEFVKRGLIENEWSKLYQDLFDLRNEGDYEDMVEITKEEVDELMPLAEDFLEKIKALLHPN